MLWIGLTGGIASGKSTVARMLRDAGLHLLDADVIAREVVEPGTPALEAIVEAFGPDILTPEGTLDRGALGARVFGDDEALATLNGIVHPAVGTRTAELLDAARERGEPLVIYDAALLVENKIYRMMDGLIVVALPRESQRARLMARDGLDAKAADARIDSQMPLEEKVAVADWVIDNAGSLENTRDQVNALIPILTARAQNA